MFVPIPIFLVLLGDFIGHADAWFLVTSPLASAVGLTGGLIIALYIVLKSKIEYTPKTVLANVFGSSRWATRDELDEWGLLGDREKGNGLFLGLTNDVEANDIIYDGDMHALTVAPTRRGKGAMAIIPNLLRSNSSILVIGPKGENARRTVSKRLELGQDVYVVDPWGVSCEADKYGEGIEAKHLSGFNPLDFLDADDPDLASDTMLLADALVIPVSRDPF